MLTGVVRRPAVAGYFYPADAEELARQVDGFAGGPWPQRHARALVVPHGSFRHAGAVLGATIGRTALPRRAVIVGPSHTSSWMPWSLLMGGAYRTPLGEVPVDEALALALQERCPFLTVDAWAQRGEHAIEVVLPFLQRCGPPDFSMVPLVLGAVDPCELTQCAEALADVVRAQPEPVVLIGSSDLSQYESSERGARQDRMVIEAIRRLDGRRLLDGIQEASIRMCGAEAVACVVEAARALGATHAELIRYGTSVEAGGDPDSVVGYAGLIIE